MLRSLRLALKWYTEIKPRGPIKVEHEINDDWQRLRPPHAAYGVT